MVIHPQSIVHSLVEYADGSVIAQLSNPDMRVPIAYALAYPERIESGAQPLDLASIRQPLLREAGSGALPVPVASPTRRCAPAARRPRC